MFRHKSILVLLPRLLYFRVYSCYQRNGANEVSNRLKCPALTHAFDGLQCARNVMISSVNDTDEKENRGAV